MSASSQLFRNSQLKGCFSDNKVRIFSSFLI